MGSPSVRQPSDFLLFTFYFLLFPPHPLAIPIHSTQVPAQPRMTCDVCKKNTANVFLTQIVDGKMQKVNLCDSCSKEKGVTDPTGFALADLLLGLGAAQEIERGGSVQKCPTCGFSQADFKKTGRLGCEIGRAHV